MRWEISDRTSLLQIKGFDKSFDQNQPGALSSVEKHLARVYFASAGAVSCTRFICSPQQISEWFPPSAQGQAFSYTS
jgi:hypothetical protein